MNFSVIPEGTDWDVVEHKYRRCYDYLLVRVARVFVQSDKYYGKATPKAELWMQTKNPMLGDVSPVSMIAHGKGNELERFIKAAEDINE